ncbi:oligosaccharide flippase family protein [Pontiellaceae bacterium B12219]|nr:oligosaccharide flippase family protein [Pontiellaceae bacterium B12219]
MTWIKNILSRLMKVQMLRHMATLVSGTAVAQLIGVLAAPVLSRVYTPEDFGVLGSLLAITGVISVVSSLKYEMAIVLEKNDRQADVLQNLCLLILAAITVLSAAGFYLAPLWIKGLSEKTELVSILPFGSLIILLTGCFNIFSFRLNRERKYKILALSNVVRRITTVIPQLIFGFVGSSCLGLIFGNIVGLLLCVLLMLPEVVRLTNTFNVFPDDLISVSRKHGRFARYTAPQNLLSALSLNTPVLLLGYFFSAEVVGFYFLAYRIMILPAQFVGNALRQVFLKEASEVQNNSFRLFKLHQRTTAGLAWGVLLPVLMIFIWGPQLFSLLLGKEWMQAGEFARWVGLFLGLSFVNPPSTCVCYVLGFQSQLLFFEAFQFILRSMALLISSMLFFDSKLAVLSYSLTGVACNALLISIISGILKKKK